MSAQRTTDTEDELELALLASVVCLIRCGLDAVNGNPEHLDNALSHIERSLQRLAGQGGRHRASPRVASRWGRA